MNLQFQKALKIVSQNITTRLLSQGWMLCLHYNHPQRTHMLAVAMRYKRFIVSQDVKQTRCEVQWCEQYIRQRATHKCQTRCCCWDSEYIFFSFAMLWAACSKCKRGRRQRGGRAPCIDSLVPPKESCFVQKEKHTSSLLKRYRWFNSNLLH